MAKVLLYTKGVDGSLHLIREIAAAEAYPLLHLPLWQGPKLVITASDIVPANPTVKRATFKHVCETPTGEHMYVLDSEQA